MNQPNSPRKNGLDALRGLAVLLMVEQHMGVWLWLGMSGRPDATSMRPVLLAFNALGGGAAPTFITLAGVGTSLLLASRQRRGQQAGTDGLLVRRGLVLLLFGLALNLSAPSWFSWGSWFVLHLMGFAIALAPLWRRLSDRGLLLATGGVFVASVAAQTWLRTPMRLTNARMADLSLPGGALRLAVVEGQFPILPWLGVFLLGALAGRWVVRREASRIAVLGGALVAAGAVGFGLLHVLPAALRPWWVVRAFEIHLGFFPASFSIVAILAGIANLAVAGMVKWEQRTPWSDRNPMVCLGRASLTLLMIHVPLFREFTRYPIPGVTERPMWQNLSAGPALAVIFGFAALAIAGAWAWRRVNYRWGAEWLLRVLSR